MLGIWHEGDWLKRDLAQPIYGRVECGSTIPGWILRSLIRVPLLGNFCVKVLDYMWHLCLLYPH